MTSKLHSGNGIAGHERASKIPATAVEVASEKEVKPVAPVDCVFRVIVPTVKVKSIIGQNGNVINKMCHETKANIRVLEGPIWHPDRVVLISGKEDIEAPLSPAMDAVIRVFKCVNGFPENESDGLAPILFCSIRLLVPSMHAMSLIGMQGSLLNTIQEKTGCSTRILPSDEVSTLSTNPDMRVFGLQGEGLKVLQALEAVLRRLHMLWHDATSTLEKHQVMSWAEKSMMHADTHPQTESQFSSSGLSCFDPVLSKNCSAGFVRKAPPSVTQDTQRMQIPIGKAVDIIGVGGTNIADISRMSGAILTVQEKKGLHNEIAVVMKGTWSQVKAARELLRIQVRTVKDWGRPAVLKPTFHPQAGTTAATETPVEPQKEPTVCSSLLQVPQSRHRPISHVIAAPSGMESIKEPKRNTICWNVNVVKTFIDACIHEITINGWDGGSLKAISWQKVGRTLKASHNFSVDDKQMKCYFNYLKRKYRAWVSLKNKTGNKYDPSTNTFNLSDNEWETEMKENLIIGLLRNAPLFFPDLCAQLFDGTISVGIKGCGPGSAKPTPETEIQTDTMSLLSPSSSNPPVKNKQKMGEASLKRQAAVPLVPSSSATGTPVEPQKEPTVSSSLLQVPQSRHRPISHVIAAPSGMESIKEPKRIKIRWHVNVVKTFLDACIHEITFNGRDGGSLKAMSWQKVGETLKASHNFSVDDKQMKIYFNGLKGKYRAWVLLKNKTGNKYDPSTNTFNLSDNEWETEMKEKPIIGLLRNAPLSFPDLCAQLFDGTISTAIKGCRSGSSKPTPETEIQTDTMSLLSPSSFNPPVENKQIMGEASLKPQGAVPLVPSSAASETPVEPQKEPMVCSSLVEVPPELAQVQPEAAYVAVETKAEVPTEWPEELMAMETEAEVPAELPPVQPVIETIVEVPPKLAGVQLTEIETEAECSVELGQVQPVIEIKAEVPTELPEVQPANALEAIEIKLEEPMVPVSTDDSNMVSRAMQMEVEEYAVPTRLDQAFSGPDHTAPGFFRTDIDQVLTGPSLDWVHHKDLPPPSHRNNTNSRCHYQSRRRTMSSPPHVAAAPSGMESIKEPKRNRYHWNDDIVETFLDACIHEIAINGQEGGSLKAMSWKKVEEVLKASHNFSADAKQMKNYFDDLKSKYKAWVSLKHKTGNKYDPSTNTFNLSGKEWETEMKENKCIEELRKVPLRFPDLCEQLFDGGIRSWGPSLAKHIPETKIQKETMSSASPSSYNPPIKNKQKDSKFSSSGLYCFGSHPGLSTKCPVGFNRTVGPSVTQVKTEPDGAFSDRTTPSSPLLGFAFASSSSSKPFSVPSPTFGFSTSAFNGSSLFGSSFNSSGISLFGPTSTFGTSTIFGASSTSAVSLPFSSVLFESPSPTPNFTTATTMNIASKTLSFPAFGVTSSSSTTTATGSVPIFANPASTGTSSSFLEFQTSHKTPNFTTATTLNTASKTLSFPAFGINSSFSTTTATGSVPIFANPASTGTSSSILGFQTSSNTVAATTPSSQPQSIPASSYYGMESIKESEQNKRKKCHHNVAGGPSGLESIKESEQNKRKKCHHNVAGGPSGIELQQALPLVPPSAPPLPATEIPQKEPVVEVPQELPQVQTATASVAIETKRTMSVLEEILGVLKMISEKMNKPEPPPKPTFDDCEKKLNELGWPIDDPLHEVAFAIFCDKNDKYRECWMKLQPERCANWVRMIGRRKKYLL